jgi:mannose-6-phosphate isomerase-like protein (cupin superfamily)
MDPITLHADEGEAIWFLDTLVTVKAAGESTGSWALVEIEAAGHAPPLHAHHGEDEAFYVLEGEMSITCGDSHFNAAAGSFVLIPKGVPHTFNVEKAKWLVLAPSGDFMNFVREMGEPARTRSLPVVEGPPDMEKLNRLAVKYDMQVLGPPPH